MKLPSHHGGPLTQEVVYFAVGPEALAGWLSSVLPDVWIAREVVWLSLEDAIVQLKPTNPVNRYAAIPVGSWTVALNNAITGTDLGLLPGRAANDLGCTVVRAVCVQPELARYPGTIFELYGPEGDEDFHEIRSISAINDGGSWVFETSGDPLPFEHVETYGRRKRAERFTCDMLYDYLLQVGAPVDVEPEWSATWVVERGFIPDDGLT